MRRVVLGVLLLASALLPLGLRSATAAAPAPTFHYVTVSDGEEIAVKVFYPPDYVDGQRYPVLFTMEGYGGAGGHNDSTFNSDHAGYVLVAASVRGTGCSGGELDLFSPRSSLDGKELIDVWMPTQPWFGGEVGIFGHSYAGLTGFLVAAQTPENLSAVAVSGLIDDFYRGILYPGGVPNPGFPVLWGAGLRVALEHQGNADELQSDPRCQANYAEHKGSNVLALRTLPDTYANRFAAEDSWAIQRGLMNHVAGIRVPVQLGQQYQDEQTGPRGGHVLWEHIAPDVPKRFVVSTGRHNPNDPTKTKKDWLDCWIRHDGSTAVTLPNGRTCAEVLDPAKRVLAFFESKGAVRNAPVVSSDWPLPELAWERDYLRADGTFGPTDPGADGSVTYASTGTGRQLTGDVGGLGPGQLTPTYRPQLPDTARFVRTFDTTTTLAGPAVATLWAATTSADVDFFVEVLDVDTATGATTFVQRGLLRATHRAVDDSRSARIATGPMAGEVYRPYRHHTTIDPVVPATPTRFDVEVFPFGHVFRPGHQMVIQVHAPPANDPISTYAYEPNQASIVSILQDPAHRSSILLPVLPTTPPITATPPACGQVVGEVCLDPGA